MKLSVSLPEADVAFLDQYAADRHLGSRSASVQHAVALLRAAQLGSAYDAAWTDFEVEAPEWDRTASDGLHAPR